MSNFPDIYSSGRDPKYTDVDYLSSEDQNDLERLKTHRLEQDEYHRQIDAVASRLNMQRELVIEWMDKENWNLEDLEARAAELHPKSDD